MECDTILIVVWNAVAILKAIVVVSNNEPSLFVEDVEVVKLGLVVVGVLLVVLVVVVVVAVVGLWLVVVVVGLGLVVVAVVVVVVVGGRALCVHGGAGDLKSTPREPQHKKARRKPSLKFLTREVEDASDRSREQCSDLISFSSDDFD